MNPFRSGFGVSTLCLAALAGGYFGGRPLLERVEFARAEADVQATRSQLSTVEDLSTVFRHVGKVIEPSVVQIQVVKTVKEAHSNPQSDEIRRYLRQHGMGDLPFDDNNGNNGDQSEEERGTGSGVIMDAQDGYGYILTNNHVAGDASEIKVLLADGREISGSANVKLLGADAKSDLAVVQIKADRLIPAKWGNSDELEKGDWVMAFGSPFGYVGSMTHGIVSALNRNDVERTQDYENFIQVDAAINPGNSGGPLVNIHGEVVGINTAIATVSGGFQGVSFAIPSNQAHTVYNDLRANGKVVRGWLGVGIADVNNDQVRPTAKYLGFTGDSGVFVSETFANTPAFGKLHEGDVITAINGQPVATREQLRNRIADMAPNTVVTLHVFHNKAYQDVQITLGNQPEDLAAVTDQSSDAQGNGSADEAQSPAALGMTLQTLDQETADRLGLNNVRSGAVITDVEPKSAADKAGLQKGDVITKVGLTPVHNAQEVVEALKKVDVSKGVPLYIVTREGSQFMYLGGDSQN